MGHLCSHGKVLLGSGQGQGVVLCLGDVTSKGILDIGLHSKVRVELSPLRMYIPHVVPFTKVVGIWYGCGPAGISRNVD